MDLIPEYFIKSKCCKLDQNTDVTVILTVWKRNNVKEQINALLHQSVLPSHIWIYQCGSYVNLANCLKKYPFIEWIKSSVNLKYFGRHTLAKHAETKYTWILDDDIIPAKFWIENCIKTCEAKNAIVCRSGRIIPPNDFFPGVVKGQNYLEQYFIGDGKLANGINICEEDTIVDYGCSSFFFKTEWEQHFWSIWPHTFQNGEDMHLSASCKIRNNIPTIVPKQTSRENSGNLKPAYSFDKHASWKKRGFNEERGGIVKYLISEMGWRPLLWKNYCYDSHT
ncbi:glycosyltransferase [Porifericola rhodea]|uniref:glycosyltransferase family 2 protein n=1 Tax=Porifericola rhodea TaxID=930972 RepID=UPI0026651009|nr:glycosyltransferase [Porifericola rhodea]WKN29769.1 glycosyltransferase [Porifericola rhodea]